MRSGNASRGSLGFTILELLVVLTAIGLLLAVAMPRYVAHVDHARETALKHDLRAIRDAIDKFAADHQRQPASLEELVARKYLRIVPVDPLTERADTWQLVKAGTGSEGLQDVRSGAPGQGSDGRAFSSW